MYLTAGVNVYRLLCVKHMHIVQLPCKSYRQISTRQILYVH